MRRAARILVEPSDYTFFNMGDVAMLQATVGRLGALCPGAVVQVLTDDPAGLAVHCPRAVPLVRTGRQQWLSGNPLFGAVTRALPAAAAAPLTRSQRHLRRRWPVTMERLVRAKQWLRGRDASALTDFLRAVGGADLVLVAGMGGITDWFEESGLELLETLELAIRRGAPTAMVGQGMGPVTSRGLRALAKEVLPRVDLIALRERRTGEPFLRSLGVSPLRTVTTGDDALELAHSMRPEGLGGGLGLNVRAGWYSLVNQAHVQRLRPILHGAAQRQRAPLVPVPISRTPGEEDSLTIRQLTAGYAAVDGEAQSLDTPPKVVRQIGRCRVVVTGSYHAAVFALAQGVPAIGLVNSSYYAAKFEGLADLFGEGCTVVSLDDRLPSALAAAVDDAWRAAEGLRPRLLTAAAQQIEQGRAAYRRLAQLVAPRGLTALTRSYV